MTLDYSSWTRFPVLTSTGRYHACPLAIENAAAHYDLGRMPQPLREYAVDIHGMLTTTAAAPPRKGVTPCDC